ncbi:MAG: PD-(D/E)XK nuclease family transposase [Cytophagales bacterium]
MPHFNKKEGELETRLDKWLYFIKHLEDFEEIPAIFKDKFFVQAFDKAEIASYSDQDRDGYEQSLKSYRDFEKCN